MGQNRTERLTGYYKKTPSELTSAVEKKLRFCDAHNGFNKKRMRMRNTISSSELSCLFCLSNATNKSRVEYVVEVVGGEEVGLGWGKFNVAVGN